MARPQIFLGDLLRALEGLEVQDVQAARSVLEMLSLERLAAEVAAPPEAAFVPRAGPRENERPAFVERPAPRVETPAPELAGARAATVRLIGTAPPQPLVPAWLTSVTALARPAASGPQPARLAPLFPREQTRGLLSAALATKDADGPLDVPRIIDDLAALRPIRELPREASMTLRRGAQVLVDAGMGMAPFRLDVDQLKDRIGDIVADDQLRTLYFTGCPLRGCAALGEEGRSWLPPPRGTPVFVITDLGIGAPVGNDVRAEPSEWLEFADAVAEAGCRVIALVPYGPDRWPRSLVRRFGILHWDRRTSAAAVRHTILAQRPSP